MSTTLTSEGPQAMPMFESGCFSISLATDDGAGGPFQRFQYLDQRRLAVLATYGQHSQPLGCEIRCRDSKGAAIAQCERMIAVLRVFLWPAAI